VIKAYTWGTPNGSKLHMMLEELGLPYELNPIHTGKGEQHTEAFIRISPNSKIPAIIDEDGPGGVPLSLFESGAILIYLADKTGRFLAKTGAERYTTLQWVMFQMANVGPYFGQLNHFVHNAPDNTYSVNRYRKEDHRLLRVLDARLTQAPYLASSEYTIADICTWPWVRSFRTNHGEGLPATPHVDRWFDAIAARPATVKAIAITEQLRAMK
jgi:GST-like protein